MRRWTAPIIIVWLLVSARPLSAQTPADSAVAAGHAGLERFRRGDFSGALAEFGRAEALAHSPVFALYVARCQRSLGRLLEARASYQKVASEGLAESAPASWRRAQSDARVELAEVLAWIPSVVVDAGGAVTRFELDGEPRTKAQLGIELELDPGSHRLVVTGPGGSATRTFDLAEGTRGFRVKLEPPPVAVRDAPPVPPRKAAVSPAPRPARHREPAPPASFLRAPVLIPLAVGALGLVAGSIAGGMALVQTNRIKSRCQGNDCDPSDARKAERARRYADIATVSFTVAGAGLAVGLGIYALGSPRSREPRVAFTVGSAL